MANNTLGSILKITSFGESHGPFVGAVLDGFPAGFGIDEQALQKQMARRRPGQNNLTTQRNESDIPQFISGIFEGKTTGAPICILIPNADAKSQDYDQLKDVFRPSHADFTYQTKYGIRDHKGGGRSSARITAAWVAAGALAEQFLLKACNMEIVAWVNSIFQYKASVSAETINRNTVDQSSVRCPDAIASALMEKAIEQAKQDGDSLGGTIACIVRHCPAGLGEPVFGKLNARMAAALFSINAVKGVEFGDGFAMTQKKGSEVNDAFVAEDSSIKTITNHSGGIQGGISNGSDIVFNIAFKPTATIGKEQTTVNTQGENQMLKATGRHDPCVLPRAVPIVESMAALVLMDLWLENQVAAFDQ